MPWTRRALAMASVLFLLPAFARADDPYADFRIPDHRTASWIIQGSGSMFNRGQGLDFGSLRDRSAFGTLSSGLAWRLETEQQQRAIDLRAQGAWNRDRTQEDAGPSFFQGQGISNRRDDAQTALLSGTQSVFLGGTDWSLEVAGVATLDLREHLFARDQHDVFSTNESFSSNETLTHRYLHTGSVSVGPALGRVRDATGIYDAQLLERRLLATGRLQRPLSPASRQKLAQIYYVQGDYGAAHDRSGKYFWREVERLLTEDGALADSTLDAYSLLRILEPDGSRRGYSRRRGCALALFGFASELRGHEDSDDRFSNRLLSGGVPIASASGSSSERAHLNDRDAGVGVRTEFHRPWGLRWQADLVASASYGGGRQRNLTLGATATGQYLIADRWYASAQLAQFARSRRVGDGRGEPEWNVISDMSLGYLVEDAWTMELSLSSFQAQFRQGPSALFQPFVGNLRESRMSFGLTYRPRGRFDAPGLGISERLTPVRL